MKEINNCPSTLAVGFHTYSPLALKRVFDKQKVSHILPYESIEKNENDTRLFMDNKKRISISGVQSKYSMIVEEGVLSLTTEGKQGAYILKPKPTEIRNPLECAANENLTMQIAEQVFKLETAANGLVFFQSEEIAYITKRFDIAPDGSKYRVEDFASLAGVTTENAGVNFKYDYSYEEVSELIKKYLPAWSVELLKFYRLVLFNFLFSNGDAHLKNFSVMDVGNNDFRLTPAYDLLNTMIHVDDTDFALDKGLFKTNRPEYFKGGKANGETFKQFGLLIGLPEKVVDKELFTFTTRHSLIDELIDNSFLSEKIKGQYRMLYQTKRNRLADMKL
ncbi:HipA domain-containing protein [Odoribacter sp. OttesenSCG-928-G04]|nr:HipA domain-containing protein [Odoribacter sp. OttesenSCG-928-G04]MDL2331185.1 HipA domain-containing protein [Odoribacter sp. OttesenSCG-928-A06]